MQIKNTSQLREFICEQLQNLCNDKIRPEQANSCAMLAANILLSIKLEMEYARLMQQNNPIKFMEQDNGIEVKGKKLLENNSR